MQIKTEQNFRLALICRNVYEKDYKTSDEYMNAALGLGDDDITNYIIEYLPKKIYIDSLIIMAKCYDQHFTIFKDALQVSIKNNNVNLEDLAIECIRHVKYPRVKAILRLLFDSYDVDPSGKHGMIFTTVCAVGTQPIVEYMIEEKNVDPNINDEMGFIFACRFGHYGLAKYLVDHCANFRAKNSLGLKLLKKDVESTSYARLWLLNIYEENGLVKEVRDNE